MRILTGHFFKFSNSRRLDQISYQEIFLWVTRHVWRSDAGVFPVSGIWRPCEAYDGTEWGLTNDTEYPKGVVS